MSQPEGPLIVIRTSVSKSKSLLKFTFIPILEAGSISKIEPEFEPNATSPSISDDKITLSSN